MPATQVDVGADEWSWLPEADYADAFTIEVRGFRTAHDWATRAFDSGRISTRLSIQAIWRLVLGLRLGALDDSRRIAGWQVIDREPQRVILGATSWQLEARVVFQVDTSTTRVTTLIRYRLPAARAVWAVVGPMHRRAVPPMLAATRKAFAQ